MNSLQYKVKEAVAFLNTIYADDTKKRREIRYAEYIGDANAILRILSNLMGCIKQHMDAITLDENYIDPNSAEKQGVSSAGETL